MLVNAGRFDLDGNVLTIRPSFVLVPEFIGGLGAFEYSLDGDTLQLMWRRIVSADGVADPNTAAGSDTSLDGSVSPARRPSCANDAVNLPVT